MIQDFQDNLILAAWVENLSGWITLLHVPTQYLDIYETEVQIF